MLILNNVLMQESEARTDLLRDRARAGTTGIESGNLPVEPASSSSQKHLNFFEDFELGVFLCLLYILVFIQSTSLSKDPSIHTGGILKLIMHCFCHYSDYTSKSTSE